jgi:hypothetical protein
MNASQGNRNLATASVLFPLTPNLPEVYSQCGPNTEKLPFARLQQAWLILRGSAEAGGPPGSLKVIYGACPARVW